MKVITRPKGFTRSVMGSYWEQAGEYDCDCGFRFTDTPDSMSAVCCPECGQEADAFNGSNFVPRSQWGAETGESF